MQSLITIRRLVLHWSICLTACLALASCTAISDSISNWEVVKRARFRVSVNPAFRTTPTLPIPNASIIANKTPQAITLEDYKQLWFQGDPCALPCWEGITPKKTKLEEALYVLNQHPFITDLLHYDNGSIGFSLSVHDRGYSGFLDYQEEPPYTIQAIRLNPSSLTLGEIVAAYGEPSYVLVSTGYLLLQPDLSNGSKRYGIGVVYSELGLVVAGVVAL